MFTYRFRVLLLFCPPYSIMTSQIKNEEILSNPMLVLTEKKATKDGIEYHSLRTATQRAILIQSLKGKSVSMGNYRGIVKSVGHDNLTLKVEDGSEKELSLTMARARQLLAGTTTLK